MDGSIAVESDVGRGSVFTFRVTLPSAVPAREPTEPTRATLAPRIHFDADILLAEDNQVNQKLATHMLTTLGCRVTLAQNGREAVELASQSSFPLILMDCQMPEMDGYEAARLIRSTLGNAPVIIALTANALPGDRERCSEAGMNGYLTKPFQRSDLAQTLDRYLPIC
jgi:CheY-like chemotaxis protein